MLTRLLLPLVLVATAAAQVGPPAPIEASFTGVVQPWPVTDALICAPPTHQLACSEGLFGLQSSSLDLSQYEGQNVKLHGTSVGDCPLFEVHAVEEPPATLALCGTAGLGCTIRLKSAPGGLAQHVLLASPSPGFVPIAGLKGSFLLGEPFFLLAKGSTFAFTTAANFDFAIPVDPALDGLSVWFQAARRDVLPSPLGLGPIQFSNAVCVTLIGNPLWCEPADC